NHISLSSKVVLVRIESRALTTILLFTAKDLPSGSVNVLSACSREIASALTVWAFGKYRLRTDQTVKPISITAANPAISPNQLLVGLHSNIGRPSRIRSSIRFL